MNNNQYTNQLSTIDKHFKHYQPPPKYEPFIPEILDKIHQVVMSALTHHQKVLFVRADLRFPACTFNNSVSDSDMPRYNVKHDLAVISRFQDALRSRIQNYVRRYSKSLTVTHSLWVREVSNQYGRHYHVLIAVNGNTFFGLGGMGKEGNLQHMIKQSWNSAMGIGLEGPYTVHFSNHHYIDLAMNEDELILKLQDAYQHFSYLAKVETKPLGDGHRVFGCSNLNHAYWSIMTQQIKRKGA
jgi:hypothetical protein